MSTISEDSLDVIETVVTCNDDTASMLEKRGVSMAELKAVFNLARKQLRREIPEDFAIAEDDWDDDNYDLQLLYNGPLADRLDGRIEVAQLGKTIMEEAGEKLPDALHGFANLVAERMAKAVMDKVLGGEMGRHSKTRRVRAQLRRVRCQFCGKLAAANVARRG